jgi:hypothetical protein
MRKTSRRKEIIVLGGAKKREPGGLQLSSMCLAVRRR